ncbi:hypothetical protein CDV55_108524 [Aspergillus turcosus]|nr:hypothetical protein CDV55_108524 [Aspergillus turcosus]
MQKAPRGELVQLYGPVEAVRNRPVLYWTCRPKRGVVGTLSRAVLVYRPVEDLKTWARKNKGHLPENQHTKLKGIIAAIEDGPEAGKPLPISRLRDHQIREILGLGPDREMDISGYKAEVLKPIKQSLNKVTRVTGLGRPQVEPSAQPLEGTLGSLRDLWLSQEMTEVFSGSPDKKV